MAGALQALRILAEEKVLKNRIKRLVKLGYPREVAERIAKEELPMDEASIAARVEEGNFSDLNYRGHSDSNPPLSDEDMFLSSSPSQAQTYADATSSGSVTPLRHNAQNLAEVRGNGAQFNKVTTNSIKLKGLQANNDSKGVHIGTDRIADAVKKSGSYDGTRFSNIADEFNVKRGAERADVTNVLGSRPDVKIRHRDAAYDPQYNGPNIMGGVALPAVGVGLLSAGQSEEADAGPLRLASGLTPDIAAKQLKNRLNKERQKGISPSNTATDFVHRNTNYDNGFLSSIKKSGEGYGGPSYVSGVKEFAHELIQNTDDPAVKSAVMEWVRPRMARGAAAGAVTASARAAAGEEGQATEEQGVIASILDKMEEMELIPDRETRIIAMELLTIELGKAIEAVQMPARGLWGTARGVFGLATGEAGHDTRRAMNRVYTQDTDESLEQAGQYVLKETGSPAAAAATSTLGMLTDPTFWL